MPPSIAVQQRPVDSATTVYGTDRRTAALFNAPYCRVGDTTSRGVRHIPVSVGNASWASDRCSEYAKDQEPHQPRPECTEVPAWTAAGKGSETMLPVTWHRNISELTPKQQQMQVRGQWVTLSLGYTED